jgi:hypothetical protein
VEPVVSQAVAEPGYEFVLGFAFLKTQLGPVMGDPVELEHGNEDNCDTQQLTTTGLAYWRCSTNMMSFAAFPSGEVHWAWAEPGLLEWTGSDADPPEDAPLIVAASSIPDDPPFSTQCLAAAPVPPLTCAPGDSLYALAAIQDSGEHVGFGLTVPPSGLQVTADLMDLPSDYDLYLVNESGVILDQSIEEGQTSEHVSMAVDGGTYFLYVNSDPGRPVDPQRRFRLQVSATTAVAAPAPQEQLVPDANATN